MSGVVVPSSDTVNYPLYLQMTNLQALITANKNPQIVIQYRNQLPEVARQLVESLVATGKLTPSNVLSACTYGASDGSIY